MTRVGAFLLLLPALAHLLSARGHVQLRVARDIAPAVLHPDQPAAVRATFHNDSGRAGRFGAAQDRVDHTLGDRPRYTVPSIPAGGTATLEYAVRSRVRGVHHLGPAVLAHPDPFGLCTATTVIPADDQILVLPQIFALPRHHLPSAGGGDGASGHSIALHGEQDVSIRAYVEGDELRRIHWHATAHRGELMVRHEDRPEHRHAVLFYDGRHSAHRASGRYSSFEWVVSATASIAALLCESHYQTHLLCPETLTGRRFETPSTTEAMVRELARVTECSDEAHADLVHFAARTTPGATTRIAVLTDVPGPGDHELAASCAAGATGIAIVVDTAAYVSGLDRPGPAARAMSDRFAAAGWRTVVAGPTTGIPQAWRGVAGGMPARMGVS